MKFTYNTLRPCEDVGAGPKLRHAKFSAGEILALVQPGAPPIPLMGFSIRRGTKRMLVFKEKGLTCAACGVVGTHFYLESQKVPARCQFDDTMTKINYFWRYPHLNPYGINPWGQEVMITVDHIVAQADGGSKEMANLQPMCAPCNVVKGSKKASGRRCAR